MPHGRKSRKGAGLSQKQKTAVKRIIGKGRETKHFHYVNGAGISQSTVATITNLSGVTQGDSDTTRDGDTLTLKSMRFSATIAGADTYNRFRIILFRWNANNATAPVVGDLLMNSAGSLVDVLIPTVIDGKSQFHIIHDRTYVTTTAGKSSLGVLKTFYGKKLGAKNIQFEGGANTGYKHVYMLTVSDSGAASHPIIYFSNLLRYTDS